MAKKWILGIVLIALLVVASACGSNSGNAGNGNEQNTATNTENTETGQENDNEEIAYPYDYTDASDETITIEQEPETIISTLPSNTEIAFAVGLDEEIIGVTKNDQYPEAAKEKEKIGGLELNIEKIIELNPDLVLAGKLNQPEGIEQLRESGIKVAVIQDASDFSEVYDTIETIGKLTGNKQAAADVVQDMNDHIDELKDKAKTIDKKDRKDVLMEISPSPEIYVAGSGSFMDQLLQVINANNVVQEVGTPMLDQEKLIELKPEVVITTYGNTVDNPTSQVINRGGWADVPAVENEAVYNVNTDIVSRPGPRLAEGAEALGKAIYPDVFKE